MSHSSLILMQTCRLATILISIGFLFIGQMISAQVSNEGPTPNAFDTDNDTAYVFGTQRIRVNSSASGLNNGTSWANAYTRLQDALTEAQSGDEIWVAAGIYKPDQGVGITPGDRTATFQLETGVEIYGGFAGTETLLSQRNPALNTTILSGDLSDNDVPVACTQNLPDCNSFGGFCVNGSCIIRSNNAENSYHVVNGSGTDATAVLDGFTIRAGNANGVNPEDRGGGIYTFDGSPTVSNCRFNGNRADASGGGMHNRDSTPGPTVANCTFNGNYASTGGGMVNWSTSAVISNCTIQENRGESAGGGMVNQSGNPKVINCKFLGNSGGNQGGGMLILVGSNATLTNCIFSGNSTSGDGGALDNTSAANSTLTNCTFTENSAVGSGGGMATFAGNPTVANCMFWNNSDIGGMDDSAQIHVAGGAPTVNYSIVQGGWTGAGTVNLNVDPLFFDPDGADNIIGTIDDNLRLRAGSPAIDTGNDGSLPADSLDLDGDSDTGESIPFDLAGRERIVGASVDKGAYEYFPDCNNNGIPDGADINSCGGNAACGDCNANSIPDECDIAACSGASDCDDCNLNGIPDGCDMHPTIINGPKLTASDAAAEDNFGSYVSVSGDTTVVGALTDDNAGGVDAGAAYVFKNSGGVWTQQQKLTASDAAAGDFFGGSVSISGNTAVVGAWQDDGVGADSGSAYVFTRSGAVWTQQQKLTASDAALGDFFGVSVSVEGDTLVVGAYLDDGVGSNSGSAYVFTRSGTVWTQQQKLTASDAAAADLFGISVSISGNTAVIGAQQDDGVGSDSGSAYVFTRSGTVWTQQQKLTASDAAGGVFFGSSVSVNGDTALIGADNDDSLGSNSGSAYVFTRSGSVWTQQQKLTAFDAATGDGFGQSVSLSGHTAVIGSYQDDGVGANSGSTYVFVRSGASWVLQQKLTAFDTAAGDVFGVFVSISGNTAIVGANLDDNGGSNNGSVYVFDIPNFDSNGNGIPDECAQYAAACVVPGEEDFWTCGGNWPTLGGEDYPDDADSAAGISARLPSVPVLHYAGTSSPHKATQASWRISQGGGSADVFLDETVEIPTLDIEPGSQLRITQTGAEGDLNFSSPGVLHSRGTIVMSGARAIGAVGIPPAVTLGPASIYQAEAGAVGVSASMTASSISVVGNDCFIPPCPHGGKVMLTDSMTVTTTGDLLIDGSLANGLCDLHDRSGQLVQPRAETPDPVVLSFHTPPSIRLLNPNTGMAVGGTVVMSGAAGFLLESAQPFVVSGDWENHSVRPDCFEAVSGAVRLNGATAQTFEVPATDTGGNGASSDHFRIGTLEVAANRDVTLVDAFDNDLQGQASCGEAQYVDNLVLEAGATLTAQNCRLYYETLTADPSAQIILEGCAEVRLAADPSSPTFDPSGLNKSRSISFAPPSMIVAGGASMSSIRVTLVSLHHVNPPYSGGSSIPFTSFEGQVRWVGQPAQYVESTSTGTPFKAASLQCTPHYQDWSTVGLLHVFGSAITPSSTYRVHTLAASCQGIEDRCTAVSVPLAISTTRWGDVETPYNPPSTTTQPDLGDVAALVNKFKSVVGAPIKARALLAGDDAFGNISPATLGLDLGFGHIAACVDAFKGKPYPHTIQACP